MNRVPEYIRRSAVGSQRRSRRFLLGRCLGVGYHIVALGICAVCVASVSVDAHAENGRIEIGAKLAPSLERHNGGFEDSTLSPAFKSGVSAGLGVRYGLVYDWLSVQAEILYATRGTDIQEMGDTTSGFDFTYLGIPMLARFRYPLSDSVRPRFSGYLLAGASTNILIDAEQIDEDGPNRDVSDVANSFDIGLLAGIGAAWEVSPTWVVSLEARYEWGLLETFSSGRASRNEAFLLTLGVDFTLTHGDADGDSIADYLDRCRTATAGGGADNAHIEDFNGYRDDDGCADATDDPDGDGILAEKDACPESPENKNGYRDDDGCPDDEDGDNDGIVVAADRCPDEAFSFNKNVNISDIPAELAGNVPGCPPSFEHVKVVGLERGDRLVLLSPLEFDSGESALTAKHRATLDEIAQLLIWYYPKMTLQVEGHADIPMNSDAERDDENKAANMAISKKRAESVSKYLREALNGRIESTRLVAVGRGAEDPLVGETSEGSRQNRRVELIITANPLP